MLNLAKQLNHIEIKLKKIFKKSQRILQYYVKKIETQVKNGFLMKK